MTAEIRIGCAGWSIATIHSRYYRLHGSPRRYFSSYSDQYLKSLARTINQKAEHGVPVWCIFDNTILDAAAINAHELLKHMRGLRGSRNN